MRYRRASSTKVQRRTPYTRRIAQKPTSEFAPEHPLAAPRSWDAQNGKSSAASSPPASSNMVPRLAPKPPSDSSRPMMTRTSSPTGTATSTSSSAHQLRSHTANNRCNENDTHKHTTPLFDPEENRRQKLKSKRDRQKQAKEDSYAYDPDLVEVLETHACKRCKSQHWRCYIPADPNSPRRTCLPCGKNKCSFGGSKSRPPTHPPIAVDDMFSMAIQRPRLVQNPPFQPTYHHDVYPASHAQHPMHSLSSLLTHPAYPSQSMHPAYPAHPHHAQHTHPAHTPSMPMPIPLPVHGHTSRNDEHEGRNPPQPNGFGHHRSNSGYMHTHPPPLTIPPLATGFPSPDLPTPDLSSATLTPFPSPPLRTPVDSYFSREAPLGPRQPLRTPVSAARNYQEDSSEIEMDVDDNEGDCAFEMDPVLDEHPSRHWGPEPHSVIHYLSSDHLRPIPLPSLAEMVGDAASRSGSGSPLQRMASTPLSSPPTSPRHHALTAMPPSSPHCPPSPLFPPSPKDLEDVTLPPLRSATTPITIPHRNSLSLSVSSLSLSLSPTESLPPFGTSLSPSPGSSPALHPVTPQLQPPPTPALLSIILEKAAVSPYDPRLIQITNDCSPHWVAKINAVRRQSQGSSSDLDYASYYQHQRS